MGHELLARPELRHPVRDDRRRPRRLDRPDGRLLPALHVLGRRPALVERPRLGRREGSRRSCSSSRSSSRSSPRSRPGSSSSRSTASASTSPTRRRSSSPATRTASSGRWRRSRRDTEVLEVANRATQHMYFTNPIKKFEERSSGLFSTHPRDARPDQPAARADRRPAARGRGGRPADRASTESCRSRAPTTRSSSDAPPSCATGSTRTTRPPTGALARHVQEGDRQAERDLVAMRSTRRCASAGSTASATRSTTSARAQRLHAAPARAASGARSTSPRSPSSRAAGRMRPAGEAAFAAPPGRSDGDLLVRAGGEPELGADEEARFRADADAWAWFSAKAPSFRRQALHWVTSAKRPETRERRLATLIEDSRAGRPIPPLRAGRARVPDEAGSGGSV